MIILSYPLKLTKFKVYQWIEKNSETKKFFNMINSIYNKSPASIFKDDTPNPFLVKSGTRPCCHLFSLLRKIVLKVQTLTIKVQ